MLNFGLIFCEPETMNEEQGTKNQDMLCMGS